MDIKDSLVSVRMGIDFEDPSNVFYARLYKDEVGKLSATFDLPDTSKGTFKTVKSNALIATPDKFVTALANTTQLRVNKCLQYNDPILSEVYIKQLAISGKIRDTANELIITLSFYYFTYIDKWVIDTIYNSDNAEVNENLPCNEFFETPIFAVATEKFWGMLKEQMKKAV